ncbi:MAG: transposase [Planctomycetota bacterium]
MPRPLMVQPERWMTFEWTARCHQARFLLRPNDECNARFLGVLGRALELYGEHVHVHFAGGTSNHVHLLLSIH